MKIKLKDRLLVLLLGLILLAEACVVMLDGLLGAGVLTRLAAALHDSSVAMLAIKAAVLILLVLLAVLCFHFAFHRTKRKDFVLQKTDHGKLNISIKTVDSLVRKCMKTHDEMVLRDIAIDSVKDGLTISLHVAMGSKISIPLAVNALQKQLKQYVTSSTGVDVKEICVSVENADDDIEAGAFRLHDIPGETVMEPRTCVPAPETQVQGDASEEQARERFLHQSLFHKLEEDSDSAQDTESVVESDEAAEKPEDDDEPTAEVEKAEETSEMESEEPAAETVETAEPENTSVTEIVQEEEAETTKRQDAEQV